MSSKSNSKISYCLESKSRFYSLFEKGFQILSDEQTIIGVQYKHDNKHLIIEDTTNDDPEYAPIVLKGNSGTINVVIVDEERRVILAGDKSGHVVQYNLKTGKLTNDYGHLGIGEILSGERIGDLVIFGGFDDVSVIRLDTQEVFDVSVECALRSVFSLRVCVVDGRADQDNLTNVYLTMTGKDPDYSDGDTDVMNITALVKMLKGEIVSRIEPIYMPMSMQKGVGADFEDINLNFHLKLPVDESDFFNQLKFHKSTFSNLEIGNNDKEQMHQNLEESVISIDNQPQKQRDESVVINNIKKDHKNQMIEVDDTIKHELSKVDESKELEEQKVRISYLEADNARQKMRIKKLEKDKEEMETLMNDCKQKYTKLEIDYKDIQKQKAKLQSELEKINNEKNEMTNQNKILLGNNHKLIRKKTKLRERVRDLKKEIKYSTTNNPDITTNNLENVLLQTRFDQFKKENQKVHFELERMITQNDSLKNEIGKLNLKMDQRNNRLFEIDFRLQEHLETIKKMTQKKENNSNIKESDYTKVKERNYSLEKKVIELQEIIISQNDRQIQTNGHTKPSFTLDNVNTHPNS